MVYGKLKLRMSVLNKKLRITFFEICPEFLLSYDENIKFIRSPLIHLKK